MTTSQVTGRGLKTLSYLQGVKKLLLRSCNLREW